MYLVSLLYQLRELGIGCHLGGTFVGVVWYEDDLILLAPNRSAAQKMVETCDLFAEKVTEVLTKIVENPMVDNFCVNDVHFLTEVYNPRSMSWKGTVPARLKDTMTNPAMYFKG